MAVLALVSSFVGCGGSSGTAQQSAPGSSLLSFAIPLNQPGSQFATATRDAKLTSLPHRNYIDTYSNGSIFGYVDSAKVMTLDLTGVTWSNTTPSITRGDPKLNSTGPVSINGGSITWASGLDVPTATLTVTVTLTTAVGATHTFGVVETNGTCPGPDPCIANNSGYVLAEGQASFTPLTTASNAITLTLGGVLEAGYLCSTIDSGCPNSQGTLGNDHWYHFVAIPTDENGNSVIPKAVPSGGWPATQTPYDSGGWQLVVTQGVGVVNIQDENGTKPPSTTSLGPFTAPNPYLRPASGLYWDGQAFEFQCVTPGTAVIAMQMVSGSPSSGSVAGFSYNSPDNYPASGALLGTVGADTHFGNGQGLIVNCSSTMTITVN